MLRYGMVGIINTGVFLSSVFLVRMTGVSYPVYTATGYVIAITVSFVLNMRFTFAALPGKVYVRAVKFLFIALSLLLTTELVQYYIIEKMNIQELIGVIASMCFYSAIGYVLNRNFVFG